MIIMEHDIRKPVSVIFWDGEANSSYISASWQK